MLRGRAYFMWPGTNIMFVMLLTYFICYVAGHIFQARPVWIHTQSNITNMAYSIVQKLRPADNLRKYKKKQIPKNKTCLILIIY